MHGVGKGRKLGARNKTAVERIIDTVVIASGGSHSDTVALLSQHWHASLNREKRGQEPVRIEFNNGNKFSDRYLNAMNMNSNEVKTAMENLINMSKNPKTVSIIDN